MDILEFIKSVVNENQAQTLVYLILANLILGTVAAIYKSEFELARFMDFGKRVLAIFGSYLAVAIAAHAMADFDAIRTVYWSALIVYMVSQIASNLKDLGIVPIPDSINQFIERPKQ